jgi:bifunctional non-homologous end joining protein LigD
MTRTDPLQPYQKKRDFTRTAEPEGTAPVPSGPTRRFVVQKHAATRLHFDFRLELDGVLKSWAVTKGPSLDPADRRLAVHVEDHPLDYGSFEGTIPEGEYGGGTVMVWDEGTWEPLGDPHEGLATGDLKFRLNGQRMQGEWVLVHMKGRDQQTRSGPRENWLLIKRRDGTASETDDLVARFETSVISGRTLEDIAAGRPARKSARRAAAQAGESADVAVWSMGKAQALPAFSPPQLATLVDHVPTGRDWLFEMKYDGYRAITAIAGDQVRIYTRAGNDWTDTFADLVPALCRLTAGTLLLDGEICAIKNGRSDFSTLKDHLSKRGPLAYFVFDILEKDGERLERRPNKERKAILRATLADASTEGPIHYSDHVEGHGEEVLNHMCANGEEGVIAKLADAPYRPDRGRSWLKIKCTKRQEFVIVGWRPSERKSTFASLILGTWEDGRLVYRGRVGTGYTHETAETVQRLLDRRRRKTPPLEDVPRVIARAARWVEPDLVAEVAFTELTPDGHLRHPSFIGLRGDKSADVIHLERPARLEATPPDGAAGVAAAKRLGIALSNPDRVVFPGQGVTKAQLIAYYERAAERMLPHLIRRPLSLVRCPQGRARACFFQKHDSGGFPDALKKVPITEKDNETKDYLFIEGHNGNAAAVQMSTL